MMYDPLEQLLRDADDATSPPRHDAALAARVRDVAARRATRRRLAAGGVVTGCVAALVAWALRPAADVNPPAPEVVQVTADPRAELIALREQADRAAALAEQMLVVERRAASRRVQPARERIDVAAQVERAAFVMVYQAGRMPADRGAASPAARVYRQVAQSFPHTRSGELARRRLVELENRKDG